MDNNMLLLEDYFFWSTKTLSKTGNANGHKNQAAMKKNTIQVFLFYFLILAFVSCEKEELTSPNVETPPNEEFIPIYSFFVAGHTYGNPLNIQYGLHPPFVNHISFLNNYPTLNLGILTGDIVPYSTQEYWDAAELDIDNFSVPIHIAAGNHDRGPLFENNYDYYYSFKKENDLFIILSPTNWNIEGAQKQFLIETIDNNYLTVNNIFIFSHELIWWTPENEFGNVEINYRPQYPGSTNYWSEINPILDSLTNNVVIFAGDMGATKNVSPYMYYKNDNITLIGSGMGGGEQDNIIIIEVDQEGELNYRLLGINAEVPYELAKLEEYELP